MFTRLIEAIERFTDTLLSGRAEESPTQTSPAGERQAEHASPSLEVDPDDALMHLLESLGYGTGATIGDASERESESANQAESDQTEQPEPQREDEHSEEAATLISSSITLEPETDEEDEEDNGAGAGLVLLHHGESGFGPEQLGIAALALLGLGAAGGGGGGGGNPGPNTSNPTPPIPPPQPMLSVGAGVAEGATRAQALADQGVIQVTAAENTTVTVSFEGEGGERVTKTVTGTGTPVAVTLSPADLNTLGDGTITVSAVATDAAGNTSSTASISFVLDTVAPAAPSLALAVDTGSSDSDGITNKGTVSVTGLESGATWQYSLNNGTNWTDGSGSSIEASVFGEDGVKSVIVRQTDRAGNVSANSAVLTFTLDTTPPQFSSGTVASAVVNIPINTVIFDANATDNGGAPDQGITYTLGGTDANLFSINANTGKVTYTTPPTQAGTQRFTVTATDLAGNTTTKEVTVTVNAGPTTTLSGLSFSADTGVSNTDFITNTAAQTIGATLSAPLAAGETLQASLDGGTNWINVSNFVVGTTLTWTGVTLLPGSNTLQLQVRDSEGKAGITLSQAYVLDTVAPAAPSLALAADTGSSNSDGITNNGTVSVMSLKSGATWEYSLDNGMNWANGSGSSIAANVFGEDGAKSVIVRQTDLAGNRSPDSAPLSFTLNTTPPTLTITASAGRTIMFTFSEPIAGFTLSDITVSNSTIGQINKLNDTTWTAVLSLIDGLTPTAEVSIGVAAGKYSDLAGNPGTEDVFNSTAQDLALSKIDAWAANSSDPTAAPTLADFHAADVNGVTAGNLGVVNLVVASALAGEADTLAKVQALADTAGTLANVTILGLDQAGVSTTLTGWLHTLYRDAGQGAGTPSADAVGRWNDAQNQALRLTEHTSADGLANGSHPLAQWINRISGTDVVSRAEFGEGFVISGQAAAGAANTIRFYLDNDRTNGLAEIGTQLQNGVNGVSWVYDNNTGAWSITFAPLSDALRPATHGTWGSGVHQLTVDTNGNGERDAGEASRLFLVAAGTAVAGDFSLDHAGNEVQNGSIQANFSVQDRITGNVFVYYYGDPDGPKGFALHTQQDPGDTASNTGVDPIGRGGAGQGSLGGDWDYYADSTTPANTPSTTANTALGHVTQMSAQIWAFQMRQSSNSNWAEAVATAGNHTQQNSNTSRMPSFEEIVALYAANFGGGGSANLPGAIQPMTDTTSTSAGNGGNALPSGWGTGFWSFSPTPSGHAVVSLGSGHALDQSDAILNNLPVVL